MLRSAALAFEIFRPGRADEGFGGLQAALHLKGAGVEITLVDRRNFHLFQPLAYQVATGALSPGELRHIDAIAPKFS